MADILKVSILGKDSIHCGFHLIPHIVQTVTQTLPSSTYVIITDTNIADLHLAKFQREFDQSNTSARLLTHIIPPGETSKSREGKAAIEDFLLANKCTRDSVILALGGGVIGDLVGFVAATFMRGVKFVQIPTTLLAMVDSSVGGKTAVDTPHGKNLIGAFWQPEYIFIDPAFLSTLPTREFSNGMAEVVKTAAIWNEQEFMDLESRANDIFTALQSTSTDTNQSSELSEAQKLLLKVIVGSISVKAHIVTIDERETGLRNLVNFGHSIGHAIEAGLTPTILHGECVSIGMILEAEIARQLGILSQVAVGRLTRTLKAYNLPVSVSDARIAGLQQVKEGALEVERLLDVMRIDKKNSGDEKKIVLLKKIGETYELKATVVRDDVIRKVLAEAVTVFPPTAEEVAKMGNITLTTPGSKSMSNRALVLAALGEGTCRLKNLLHSDDTQVMMAALGELKGAEFSWEDGGDTLVVNGGKGKLQLPPKGKELYLGNAGTAARFLTTVCTLVQAPPASAASDPSAPTTTIITGNARMKQRPIAPLVTALQANGSAVKYLEGQGCLPLEIAPGGLKGGTIQLDAKVSSQYVSSVLLCAPYARDEDVRLELVGGEVISQPYIDMTIAMMRTFGIEVERLEDPNVIETEGPRKGLAKQLDIYRIPRGVYKNPAIYRVESDASSATYPLAVAGILGENCRVRVDTVGKSSLQGDALFGRLILGAMGCEVRQGENGEEWTEVRGCAPDAEGYRLKAIEYVDMTVMTDAFLTATALAAVAKGTTTIVGIANQRVKECNRIRAMIDELAKFGVECKELPDGLSITGRPPHELNQGVSVHCYDDHRVAMAFSVLACVVPGTILEEKRCVEKTWPGWWDDLQGKIGVRVGGVDLAATRASSSSHASASTPAPAPAPAAAPAEKNDASVILIGMRGAGKSYIGAQAAKSLGYTFLDADTYFEDTYCDEGKSTVRDYVAKNGWETFRAKELEALKSLLAPTSEYSKNHVISLGGGVVETPEARELLKSYAARRDGGAVVEVTRPVEEVVAYLDAETGRPKYAGGETVEDVWKRREGWYKECARWLFVNGKQQGGEGLQKEIARFFGHVTARQVNFVEGRDAGKVIDLSKEDLAKLSSLGVTAESLATSDPERRSYFVCLTYSDVRDAFPYIDELTEGVDAIELRVDLLKDPAGGNDSNKNGNIPPISYVRSQLAALRRVSDLPIIYTVRTKAQGGAFPDDAFAEALALLEEGARLGAEYLDVEVEVLPKDGVAKLVELTRSRGGSKACKILSSWHDWSGAMKWDGADVQARYDAGAAVGDIVKLVGKAETMEDNFTLREFVAKNTKRNPGTPLIAINMGAKGQLSRILNGPLTPVSHPAMPNKAAPGQVSFKEIQEALGLMGLIKEKKFYLFGTPIAHSMSPTLHNASFDLLGLGSKYKYELLETKSLLEGEDGERIKQAVFGDEEAFGGASVTIPYKLDVVGLCDVLTDAARRIGAVNTVIPVWREGRRVLVGDNSDWLGIRACITRTVQRGQVKAGLVVGAGGTSRAALYALVDLRAPVVHVFNRTKKRAEELVGELKEWAEERGTQLVVLDRLDQENVGGWNVIVGTVPASGTTIASDAQGAQPDLVKLPETIYGYREGPAVVLDMAYKPAETPLLELARRVGAGSVQLGGTGSLKKELGGAEGGGNWACVPGVEALLEQGYVQFEKWTGRRCPREQVATKVWARYNAA